MRLFLDTSVWGGAIKTLEAAGHDVVWTGYWPEDPGDEEILTKAYEKGREISGSELRLIFRVFEQKSGWPAFNNIAQCIRVKEIHHKRTFLSVS